MSFPRYESYKDSGLSWLGKIPSHWGIMQSRRLFSLRKDKATETDRQLTASQKHGVLYQDDYTAIEGQKVVQVITGAEILKHAEPNDFVISMRSFQGGIEWCGYRGSISSAYVMLIPSDTISVRFFSYLFKCKPYIQALQSTSNLVRDGQALRYDNFTLIHLPVLPYLEQQTIAAFLDRETAKIDALITEQQRLIELLKEKRQTVISHAVTKGLNPNAPMKDSGIEWLGDVPKHWEVSRIKYHCEIKGRIGFRGYTTADQVDEGSGALTLGATHITATGEINLDEPVYISWEKYYESPEIMVSTSNILVVQRGSTCGKIGFVEADIGFATINPSLVLLKNFDCLPKLMFFYFFSTLVQGLFELVLGNTAIPMLSQEQIGDIAFCLPPLKEQEKIVNFITNQTTKLDTLATEAKTAITLLQERRTALISAAVTGKIDVRELVSAKTEVKAETVLC